MSANTRFPVAVHVMTTLAYHDGRAVSSPQLAESVGTNPVVIRRTLGQLRRAGLVRALPGQAGGARLARPAGTITLLDIYTAVGGGSAFALPDKPEQKECPVSCGIKRLLAGVQAEADRAVAHSLARVRLSDMARDVAAAAPG